MCTANEVALVNTVYGAYLAALAARDALIVVDHRKIVNDVYSVLGTSLFTLAASDTSVKAELADYCALIVVGALNDYSLSISYEMDYSVRTGPYAKTASDALSLINHRNSALGDLNSVLGTDGNTVAVAKTSVYAGSVALVKEVCRTAGLRSVVIILSVLVIAYAVAGNVSNHLNYVLSLNSEYSGDLSCRTVASGSTKVSLFAKTL